MCLTAFAADTGVALADLFALCGRQNLRGRCIRRYAKIADSGRNCLPVTELLEEPQPLPGLARWGGGGERGDAQTAAAHQEPQARKIRQQSSKNGAGK